MANGNGIKEAVARVAETDREARAAKTELDKKFANARKVIGGCECSLSDYGGTVRVRLVMADNHVELSADVLNNIGGWLKKHYGDSLDQTDAVLSPRPKKWKSVEFDYHFSWYGGGMDVHATAIYEIHEGVVYVDGITSAALHTIGGPDVVHLLAQDRLGELEKRAKEIVQARQ